MFPLNVSTVTIQAPAWRLGGKRKVHAVALQLCSPNRVIYFPFWGCFIDLFLDTHKVGMAIACSSYGFPLLVISTFHCPVLQQAFICSFQCLLVHVAKCSCMPVLEICTLAAPKAAIFYLAIRQHRATSFPKQSIQWLWALTCRSEGIMYPCLSSTLGWQ